MKILMGLLILLVGCSSILPYERPTGEIRYEEYIADSWEREMAYLMWEYTNEERINNGLPPLYWDTDLEAIALLHSQDMANRGYYEHVDPEGASATDRARLYGYALRKVHSASTYTEGVDENLGQVVPGPIKDFRTIQNTTKDLAHAQVELWMNSPDHRKNILDPRIDKIGIGVVWNGSLYLTTQVMW